MNRFKLHDKNISAVINIKAIRLKHTVGSTGINASGEQAIVAHSLKEEYIQALIRNNASMPQVYNSQKLLGGGMDL